MRWWQQKNATTIILKSTLSIRHAVLKTERRIYSITFLIQVANQVAFIMVRKPFYERKLQREERNQMSISSQQTTVQIPLHTKIQHAVHSTIFCELLFHITYWAVGSPWFHPGPVYHSFWNDIKGRSSFHFWWTGYPKPISRIGWLQFPSIWGDWLHSPLEKEQRFSINGYL